MGWRQFIASKQNLPNRSQNSVRSWWESPLEYTSQEGSGMRTMERTQDDRLGGMGRALDLISCVSLGQWLPQWSLASFVMGRGWTCESSRSPPSAILSESIDLSLTASTLFFPVLFLVLSRSNQLTSRCNSFSRCFFFFWKAFHFASILNYRLTCYCPIDLPAMMAVVISALVILVATSAIDNWALEMWPVWLRNWTWNYF